MDCEDMLLISRAIANYNYVPIEPHGVKHLSWKISSEGKRGGAGFCPQEMARGSPPLRDFRELEKEL